jgi:peptide subunit release factor 1 (eRF1)
MNRVERYVEAQRDLFAAEAAEHIQRFLDDDDLLVVAGPEEARAQLLNSIPEEDRETAIEFANLDPTQPERELLASLTDLVVEVQYQAAAGEVVLWFDGENGSLALGGIESNMQAAEQGRLDTLILHEDAVDHFGNYDAVPGTRGRLGPHRGGA